MENFLRQLNLSDNAIKLYFYCLSNLPLTYNELSKVIPNISKEESETIINELINPGLLKKIAPEHQKTIKLYKAQPPITQILQYYDNISNNLKEIKGAIQSLLRKSLNKVFDSNNEIELETIYSELKDIIEDIDEDTLLQKQEIKEILKEMETLKSISDLFTNFKEKVINLIKEQIEQTSESILEIKSVIIEKLRSLELKKKEILVYNIIEQILDDHVKNKLLELNKHLQSLIEGEYKNINEKVLNLLEKSFKRLVEIKTLLMGMMSNFDAKMKDVFRTIEKNKNNLDKGITKIKTGIIKNINSIVQGSIDQVNGLNKPMQDVLKQYFIQVSKSNEIFVDKLWVIKSRVKLEEELTNLIANAKERLTIIVPKIENFFSVEQIETLPGNLVINLASTDPPTNSRIKKLNYQANFSFKNIQNENIIVFRCDDNYFLMALILDYADNELNNIVGLGCNYIPLIKIFSMIIDKFWTGGSSSSFITTSKSHITPVKMEFPQYESTIPVQDVVQKTIISETIKKEIDTQKIIKENIPVEESNILEPNIETQPKIIEHLPTKTNFFSTIFPDANDFAGALINEAFNQLLSKLNQIKGTDFSFELEQIAELILEKKGFSVTLHNIRSCINKYKETPEMISESDQFQIFEAIESWKQHLFTKKK
ncbi:MAG: hypothetical protein ACFFAS_17555 [Promethearchaeota archaeon]